MSSAVLRSTRPRDGVLKAPPPSAFGALKHRNFQLFFAGHLVSLIGWWMHHVAQPWLVLLLTDSAFYVGLVALLGTLPVTLLSLFGGAVADRFPKRRVVLATQVAAMGVALALAAVVLADVVTLAHVMVAATLIGVVAAFDIPGRQAFMVEMVGKRDLMNAIALNSSAFNASRIVGPAVAGVLIGTVGVGLCFLLNGFSYLAVIAALLAIRIPTAPSTVPPHSTWTTIREGLAYVAGNRRVRALLLMIASASLFAFPFQMLMPVLARDVLGLGAQAYGLMVTSAGVGALVGALGLASFARHIKKGRAVTVAAGTFGLLVALLGAIRSFPLILMLLVLIGFAMIVHTATTNTLLQTVAPDALRGRVMSVYTLAFMGLLPFGSLLAGAVAERFGPGMWLTGGGLLCSLFTFTALRTVPEVWRME